MQDHLLSMAWQCRSGICLPSPYSVNNGIIKAPINDLVDKSINRSLFREIICMLFEGEASVESLFGFDDGCCLSGRSAGIVLPVTDVAPLIYSH